VTTELAPDPTTESAAEQRVRPRSRVTDRCALAFVLTSLLFGTVFAIVTPPLWGPDEFTHVSRAYAVAHGRFLPQRVAFPPGAVNYGGLVPSTVDALTTHATRNYGNPPQSPAPAVVAPEEYRRLAAQPLRAPLAEIGFANTSAYSPVSYLPAVLVLRTVELADGTVGTALTLMRLVDLVTYTALVWLALRSCRDQRFKWVIFVAALLPMSVFQASMITADAMTNGLAILFGALFARAVFFGRDLSRSQTAMLAGSAILLPLAKPTYVILALLLPLVPANRLTMRRWGRPAASAAGLLAFGAWTTVSAETSAAMGLMRPGEVVDPAQQTEFILSDIPRFALIVARTFAYLDNTYFIQFFGALGQTFVPVPALTVVACIVAGVLAFGMAEHPHLSRPRLIAAAAVVLLSAAAIFGTLYLEFSPVGRYQIEGVQGRYFLPLVVVGVAVALRLVPIRLHLPTPRAARSTAAAVVALMAVGLALSAAKYYYVMWH
jgi:uncharacterized membrane protein